MKTCIAHSFTRSITHPKTKLSAAQLPINDTTKFIDFMKSEVMVDMMNFLKIMINPMDIMPYGSNLRPPKRGIGAVAPSKT